MELTVKIVLISVSSVKGYPRWVYRTVICPADKRGYLSESNVHVIYESEPLYRPYTSRGKGSQARATAERIRDKRMLQELGV